MSRQRLSDQTSRLCFIGAGNMASSIIGGLIHQEYPANLICASDPDSEQLSKLERDTGIKVTTDNQKAVSDADVLILAVKPQIMKMVCEPLALTLGKTRPLVVSIAAGITVGNLLDWLGQGLPIVRTMPNTPALVQTGATGLYATDQVTQEQRAIATTVFEAIGLTHWFNQEQDMDRVVAISGSGPAYFFLVMEAIEQAGIKLGLDAGTARELTLQTALGAARLAMASDVDPAELRRRVTSPGGTTEAALQVLQKGGLVELFDQAVNAASNRSKELAD